MLNSDKHQNVSIVTFRFNSSFSRTVQQVAQVVLGIYLTVQNAHATTLQVLDNKT